MTILPLLPLKKEIGPILEIS